MTEHRSAPASPSSPYWQRRAEPRVPAPGTTTDVLVVGAGVTGLCAALLLARAGKQVVVLEAGRIGELASGRNTGKVSALQGVRYDSLLDHHPVSVVEAYVTAQLEGAAWLTGFSENHGVPHQLRDAITFAAAPGELELVAAELAASERLGLGATWRSGLDVPFEVHGAISMPGQTQVDPLALVEALAAEVERHGGQIGEQQRVVAASWGLRPTVRTADGAEFTCDELVLATGTPILDRGLYFAKLLAQRSYLLAFTDAEPPPGMLISAGRQPRSLTASPGDEPVLLVGGGGHVVGRQGPELANLDEIRSWVATHYPTARETHAWSAQDYLSHDGIPYVGHLPRGRGRIWVASGYAKWGLANGASAALRISAGILGTHLGWARPLERRITRPEVAARLMARNLQTVAVAAAGLARAETRTVSPSLPTRTGDVGRDGPNPWPVGVVSAGCAVRATCTHLGGTLRWNDAERSWDCPLHGSRFAADGAVLEGPAVAPLKRINSSVRI